MSARERTAEPVLVPGAGSAAGVGAIKALRMAGFRGQIVATDADPMAPGLELADVGAVLPRAAAPEFLPRALDLIRREGVRVILPTSSFDTPVYAGARAELRNAGATLVACDPEAIESCLDRRRFVERFAGSFPLPRTVAAEAADTIGFPCVARAARALGGRSASICGDAEALERRLAYGDDVIVQAYQPGVEYAVDVLGISRADLSSRRPGSDSPSTTAARCGATSCTTTRSRTCASGSRRPSRSAARCACSSVGTRAGTCACSKYSRGSAARPSSPRSPG